MSETIAALRARVRLEAPVRTLDDLGGAAPGWNDEGVVWAEVSAGGAGEGAAFDTARSASAYRVTIRPRSDVRAGWRVVWGARRLRVRALEDEGGVRIVLVCEEEVL